MIAFDALTRRPRPKPVLRAEELRERCVDGQDLTATDRRIVGRLDLSGVHIRHALRFVNCDFEDRIDLSDARAGELIEWHGGRIAGIVADRFQSRASVTVSDVDVRGTISLRWAHLQGDLRLTNSSLQVPEGVALQASDLRLEGSLFLDGDGRSGRPDAGVRARGEVRLASAYVGGSIDCRRGTFVNPSACTINGYEMTVEADLLCCDGFRANGEVYLERATVNRFRADGGTFRSGANGYALRCDALRARSGVFLDRGFAAFGKVRLVGADITGQLSCTHGRFSNPGDEALEAWRLHAEEVYLDHAFRAEGAVRLDGAHLTRQLNCTNGMFFNEKGYALDADGMQCDGSVFLDRGFNAKGEVRLVGARINTELNCTAGRFDNPGGRALNADGLDTPGSVFLNSESEHEFHALGEVRLARATVGRQLMLSGATLVNGQTRTLDLTGLVGHGDVLLDHGFHSSGPVQIRGARIDRDLTFSGARLDGGVDAQGVRIGGTLTWEVSERSRGEVNLSFATVETLQDTLINWPEKQLALAGFSCRAPAETGLDVEQWITWLGRTKAHYSDAYHQLGQAYQRNGNEAAAKQIAIARQRDLRKPGRGDLGRPARVWNWLLDVTTRFGYELHRPLILLLVMAVIGSFVFLFAARAGLMVAEDPQRPWFQPFVYSVQLLVPGVDLRLTSRWLPDTDLAWGKAVMVYIWLAVVIGWLASGALIAGIGRFFRQGS
ncbi:hypothetical protein SAMN05660359_04485 [Geodermatophilus obscurus]|uniref:Membrane-associated oxidoreductase n=1 Tax=Geodermatophilus obscurus TaxID=1861 RepID=A0A1I5ICW3_9ACTN|nr:hypothetical protein [Geodermatophilus obscurus]SFO58100.1 hypothetical protein SAMN05660359_04485 [Geodermatophilus obscurus]